MDIDPKTMVRDLDASYKQIVEIARALMMNAKLIIMDEPTTSLTEPEIQHVFSMMRTLKKHGVGIVFISHKLREVMEFCDRYTVLRDGLLVAQGDVCDTNINELAKFMVGHEVRTESLRQENQAGEEVLRLEDLSLEKKFEHISLSVHSGEILGITGLLGTEEPKCFRRCSAVPGDMKEPFMWRERPTRLTACSRPWSWGSDMCPGTGRKTGS